MLMTPDTDSYRPPPAWRIWGNALLMTARALTGAYALSVIGSLLLHHIGDEAAPIVAFTNAILHITTLPALVLWPLCLISRRWGLVLLLTLPAAAWISWFGGRLLPVDVPPPPPSAPQIRVLTYNLFFDNDQLDDALALIVNADADLVLLQEYTHPTFDALDPHLDYPYQATDPGGIQGIGLYSRYPIIESMTWEDVLAHQRVELEVAGQPVVVYNVHPPSPFIPDGFVVRNAVIARIMERVQAESLPVILAGDFNLTDLGQQYDDLTRDLTDAFVAAGRGLGNTYFLRGIPMARIDYVFASAAFQPVAAAVQGRAGSDHAALLATLAFIPSESARN
jgi:vancomycin resistance protein VanJ